MIMAVPLPELRGAAFAIYLSLFEAAAIAAFSLGAGFLGGDFGLRAVFLWVLVVLVLVNGIFLSTTSCSRGRCRGTDGGSNASAAAFPSHALPPCLPLGAQTSLSHRARRAPSPGIGVGLRGGDDRAPGIASGGLAARDLLPPRTGR
ncbi:MULTISPECIES: hypothetical protein [unclassified Streptomyces]|uniref:hypothetical protein n=1 Tax=unclassified Streptomyces TaxID=2593676 RepID=UPI0037199A6A